MNSSSRSPHQELLQLLVWQKSETARAPDIEFTVPIIVEAKAGPTWAEAH